ncbi:MAG: tellurite resistance TerB family protein [Geminicoccaceae bacterium]
MNAQDLLGQLMQAGLGPNQGRTTSRRLDSALGAGQGGGGGLLGQILGGLQGGGRGGAAGGGLGGLGDLLGGAAAGSRGGAGGGGLGDLLGGLQGSLGKAGQSVQQGNPLAVGGLGALAGILLGRGNSSVGNAIGGAGLAVLGSLAMQAFRKMAEQKALTQEQIPTREDIPIGVRPPETPGEEAILASKATIILQAMISAAKADGQIDGGEVQRILGKVQEGGADTDAIAFLQQEMKKPLDLDALVAQVSDPTLAAEVYAASLMAIEVDTPQERAYLQELARGLRLDPLVVAELHRAVGAPQVA